MKPYYSDGGCAIYHGDCREIAPYLDFDVIVTDPPYGIGWRRGAGTGTQRGGARPHDGIVNDDTTEARDELLAISEGTPALVFGSFYAPAPTGVRQVLVWHKGDTQGVVGSTSGFRRDAEPIYLVGNWPTRTVAWSSVVRSSRGSWNDELSATGHPHTKPIDLMRWLIERCPCGDILDPFMGSGSTLRAAKDLGRSAVGIEIDERYCEIAAKRLAQEVLAL